MIPTVFQGTWYQTDRYSKTARKFIITKHTIMDSVVYQKTYPNLNLNHRSEKIIKFMLGMQAWSLLKIKMVRSGSEHVDF